MDLREYQLKLLQMAKDFAQMCDENGLKYYLGGGACLGAIRHRGFIPWDDDIDIVLPRKDYDRLPELVREKMPEKYELYFRENAQIFQLLDKSCPITMVNDNMTMGQGNTFHMFIDLFPLDGCPAEESKRKKLLKKIKHERFFFKLGYVQYCYAGGNHSRFENMVIRVAKKLHLERIFKKKTAKHAKKLASLYRRYDYETSDWAMASYGIYGIKDTFPKEVVGEGTMVPFEDTSFRVFSDADRYLTQIYGDYMTPRKIDGKAHIAEE